ncbi:MAG: nuclear transport factor 2 family protein [Sphingomonas bacterium]
MSLILAFLAQITPMQPMPKGTGLPPPGTDEGAVMAPINALFAGLAARDSTAIMAQLRPEGGATAANEAPNGTRAVRHMSWAEFAAGIKPGPEKYEERISNPAIEIDGDIAMVWAPYTFLIDGKAHHCGVDHFDLVREAGAWKIVNITWTARATGCEG